MLLKAAVASSAYLYLKIKQNQASENLAQPTIHWQSTAAYNLSSFSNSYKTSMRLFVRLFT